MDLEKIDMLTFGGSKTVISSFQQYIFCGGILRFPIFILFFHYSTVLFFFVFSEHFLDLFAQLIPFKKSFLWRLKTCNFSNLQNFDFIFFPKISFFNFLFTFICMFNQNSFSGCNFKFFCFKF